MSVLCTVSSIACSDDAEQVGGSNAAGAGNTGGAGTTGGAASDAGTGGACTADVSSDPDHCGACSHSCVGGRCVEGTCEAVELITFTDAPSRMAIGGAHVVWVDIRHNNVGHVTKNGSSPISYSAGFGPSNVAATATHVYWTVALGRPDDTFVKRLPFAGGSIELLATGVAAWELALDETRVYWSDRGAYSTHSALHDGSDKQNWWETSSGTSLQVDAERLFWFSRGDVHSCPKTNCATETPMGLSLSVGGDVDDTPLAVDETHVYIGDELGLLRVDKYSGLSETLSDEAATGLALRDDQVYFTVSSKGLVARIAKTGGEIDVIVADQSQPTDIRVDDDAVYWLDVGDAAIRKIAKPLP